MVTHAQHGSSMTETRYLVFVYGTLKSDGRNHHLLKRGRFVGMASTEPKFRLLDAYGGGFPYLVPGERSILGELYDIDGGTLFSLDRLEGYRLGSEMNHYNRETIVVTVGNQQFDALVYVLNEQCVNVKECQEFHGNEWIPTHRRRHT